jgi:hypothetical protein
MLTVLKQSIMDHYVSTSTWTTLMALFLIQKMLKILLTTEVHIEAHTAEALKGA